MTLDTARYSSKDYQFSAAHDDALERLDARQVDAAIADGKLDGEEDVTKAAPFDLHVVEPLPVSVRALYKAAKKPLPTLASVTAKDRVPLLLMHRVTAAARPFETPPAAYEVGMFVDLGANSGCSTISLMPATEYSKPLLKLGAKAQVGLSASGGLSLPKGPVQIDAALGLGAEVGDVKAHATADVDFGIAFSFRVRHLEVQSFPRDGGSAEWRFYHSRDTLQSTTVMLHTLLVPRDARSLEATVTVWGMGPRRLFGERSRFEPLAKRYTVPLGELNL